MSMDFREKRKNPRRKVSIPVLCWEMDDEKRVGTGKEIVSKDLSCDGIAFYSHQIYPIGTVLGIDIYLPSLKKPIFCKLRVLSIESLVNKDEYIIGAAFFDIKPEDKMAVAASLDKMNLYLLLESTIKGGATDLHLTVGRPPMVRKNGRILPMAADVIDAGQVEAMLYPLLSNEQVSFFEKTKELDFAFSPNLSSRFRVNMHSQRGYIEATLRSIPTTISSFRELGLPVETMEKFCSEKSGLILIAGTTGSGKTTTMISMVDYINQHQERVIVTVEDPIEYTLESRKSIVKQRELGSDTSSYAEALRRVLRQDPDVVCIGEILNSDCLMAAMRAAETGHLVISTVHAPDTVSAIERLISLFPPEHSQALRQQLSSSLISILFQLLLPKKQGGGRVLASEFLINNTAMKHLIREGKYTLMGNVLQTGRAQGMYMLKDNLKMLCDQGLIEHEVMMQYIKSMYTQQ